jgi:hypothetical protein
MKHLLLGLGLLALLGAALAVSGSSRPDVPTRAAEREPLVERNERNPWTGLNLNNDPAEFQFAVVSDRTGGHRARVFSKAVELLNLMQPEFVLSVGDLIEGGSNIKKIEDEWKEVEGFTTRLQMPFFYVPGNHDAGTKTSSEHWQSKFGRRYYHFVYRDVLFLCLNTEDPPGSGAGHFDKEQIAYAKETLQANRDVRWTIVAMHKPVWTSANLAKSGWLEIEQALVERPYTVFVGHVHRYQKFIRNGREYYQLATTGGGSKMRGVAQGEFDHVMWVTMKKTGPVFAVLCLDAILPEDLRVPETKEPGSTPAQRKKVHPVKGFVFLDGVPVAGAYVVLQDRASSRGARADAFTEADGSFVLSTYQAGDGAAEGEYAVTVVQRQPFVDATGKPGPNRLPEHYAKADTTLLRVGIKPGVNDLILELRR